jgi:hypothetical protein
MGKSSSGDKVAVDTVVRVLPTQEPRVETGIVQFENDWNGLYIRGDNAYKYATLIQQTRNESNIPDFFDKQLEELEKLFISVHQHGKNIRQNT